MRRAACDCLICGGLLDFVMSGLVLLCSKIHVLNWAKCLKLLRSFEKKMSVKNTKQFENDG